MQIFNEIHFRNTRGDVFGGVTAAVVALPMALAFGVASGAGAEAGIYGAILVGLFASLFGGSSTLISEPTGPMTVLFTAVLATLIASDPENGKAMAFTVVILAGLFQILFGALRLGKYITLMPYSVISGFMSGIGIILVILQIGPLVGQPAPAGGVLGTLGSLPDLLGNIKLPELLLAFMTMAILFFVPSRFKKYVPPQLIALVVGTLVSIWFLQNIDLRRIGEIPTGLPSFQMPHFSPEQWRVVLVDAIALGMLGCIDALLTSVIADSMTGKRHNSDKELLGQGLGNVMSGMFGGLPGAGATMGTVVNIQAGARTALSSLVRVAILVVVVLWAADLTASIPLAVLAGIALKVGLDIIDWKFLKRAHRLSTKGALITYAVILLTVFVDLIVAVGIGLFVANIMTVTKLSKLQSDDVNAVTDPENDSIGLSQKEKDLLNSCNNQVVLMHLRGAMIFGSSRLILEKSADSGDFQAMILDLGDVTHLGVSASLAIEEVVESMRKSNKSIYLTGLRGQPRERLNNIRLFDQMRPDRLISDRQEALEHAVAHLKDNFTQPQLSTI